VFFLSCYFFGMCFIVGFVVRFIFSACVLVVTLKESSLVLL